MTALTLDRARAGGALATRERLGAALGWWRADPAAQDEWLVVPRLQLAFSAGRNQAPDAVAREFARVLARERSRARIDPPPGEAMCGPVQFTRASRWYAWLAGRTVAQPTKLPALQRVEISHQLRTELLGEAQLLIAVAQQLARADLLVRWIAQLADDDCDRVLTALREAVGRASTPPQQSPVRSSAQRIRVPRDPLALVTIQARELLGRFETLANLPPRHSPQGQAVRALLAAITQPPLAAMCMAIVTTATSDECAPSVVSERPTETTEEPPAFAQAPARDRSAASTNRPAILPRSLKPPAPDQPPTARTGPDPLAPRSKPSATRLPIAQPALPIALAPAPVLARDLRFETAFAGVLFLLNCFTALELYPDFARPLGERLAPSSNWLLVRVARAVLGLAFARDPLFRWLAETALPGPLPARWQVPRDWEDTFAPPRRFRARDLAVDWDRRGFFAELAPLPPRQAARQALPRSLTRLLPQADALWLGGFVQYLRYRLNQAEVAPDDLRLPGSVTLRDGELVARIALAHLPLAVRLAGLDRDPGWLPAEGRAIRFEFF